MLMEITFIISHMSAQYALVLPLKSQINKKQILTFLLSFAFHFCMLSTQMEKDVGIFFSAFPPVLRLTPSASFSKSQCVVATPVVPVSCRMCVNVCVPTHMWS